MSRDTTEWPGITQQMRDRAGPGSAKGSGHLLGVLWCPRPLTRPDVKSKTLKTRVDQGFAKPYHSPTTNFPTPVGPTSLSSHLYGPGLPWGGSVQAIVGWMSWSPSLAHLEGEDLDSHKVIHELCLPDTAKAPPSLDLQQLQWLQAHQRGWGWRARVLGEIRAYRVCPGLATSTPALPRAHGLTSWMSTWP